MPSPQKSDYVQVVGAAKSQDHPEAAPIQVGLHPMGPKGPSSQFSSPTRSPSPQFGKQTVLAVSRAQFHPGRASVQLGLHP